MKNLKRYWSKVVLCPIVLGIAVVYFAKGTSVANSSGMIFLQMELKNGYASFTVPETYLSNISGRQWRNGKAADISGFYDDRTLCPYIVTQEEYASKAYMEENGQYKRYFRLEYSPPDFVSKKIKDFIKRSTGVRTLITSDTNGVSFEKYVRNMPNGMPFEEGFFPENGKVYINCPSGETKNFNCSVEGEYKEDIGYYLMIPKTDIFSYEIYIEHAMRLFKYFDEGVAAPCKSLEKQFL